MDAHMIDSGIFGHQWTTPEARAIFAEPARVARWVEVLIALARAQADCGIIPQSALSDIEALARTQLPLEEIAERTRATSHSTLGMIQVLREHLPQESREYVYYGTTVQDITDTAQVLELRAVARLIWRDLWQIEADLLDLAETHRETPMVGRTHGQPGSPISFGLKAAVWADEVGRHLHRLKDGRDRWLVGQLAGAVGSLGFFGDQALHLRKTFCVELGLGEPDISWINARDRLAEFAHLLAMSSATLARMSNEVFTLQRLEIGELAEKTNPNTVGSITMPHKRNPEASEQIVALARLIRANAAILTETMVQENERDARGWKVEWAVFPELCHYTLAATSMSRQLVAGLEVNTDAMARNLGDTAGSERVLSRMSDRLGKHVAQGALQDAFLKARDTDASVHDTLAHIATADELTELARPDIGASAEMVDRVIATATRRRMTETDRWPDPTPQKDELNAPR